MNKQNQQLQLEIRDCGEAPTLCLCGCEGYTNWDRKRRHYGKYLKGHQDKVTGKEHPQWKGSAVGIETLHRYVRKYKPKPENGLCEICKEKPYLDLANISPTYNPDTYTRDLDNWRYVCRLDHMKSDGRIERFYNSQEQRKYCNIGNMAKAKSKQGLGRQ